MFADLIHTFPWSVRALAYPMASSYVMTEVNISHGKEKEEEVDPWKVTSLKANYTPWDGK